MRVNVTTQVTLDYLSEHDPQLLSQKQIAEIFQWSVSWTRKLIASGDLSFKPIVPKTHMHWLVDIAVSIDGKNLGGDATVSKRGRPVGSRNKAKTAYHSLSQL